MMMFWQEQSRSEVFESRAWMTVHNHTLQAECLRGDELHLGDQVVRSIGGSADQAVLATNEAEQPGNLKVAQVLYLVEDSLICHDRAPETCSRSICGIRRRELSLVGRERLVSDDG